ncbi:MAG TPA: 1,4-alpha-glucan branching protein GlgB, partial [Steroidobacteraceae bacterium]|nr:1,4-alpha-glucan branching protein GlgB [Steroidobacteraceae bacterium]
DPHGVLGAHAIADGLSVIVHLPAAARVRLDRRHDAQRIESTDFFAWRGGRGDLPAHYRVSWIDAHGATFEQFDPYCFAPTIGPDVLARFASGRDTGAWRSLGAHACTIEGVAGVRFSVWAPDAERVSVVGPFCLWDGRRYPMRVLGASGVWEVFVPGIEPGELYKFELRNRATGAILLKSDPYARASERRPATASIVTGTEAFRWSDEGWLERRARHDWLHAPMSIYEVHLASWRRKPGGEFLRFAELADELVPYVAQLGYTHIELLPITEHPLDDSWGYQTTGYFSPTSRHGTPDELRAFIDRCHASNLGVLLDWVPGHFPRDAHGLASFDGTALYEYHDARKAEHRDWGTLIFNYERHEVRSFLLSSACYWLQEFHFDGLRVDAVASMLYLDFSKRGGDFTRNRHGGNHNLEAIDFLRDLNAVTHAKYPGTVVIAEESTEWPRVSRPAGGGGLGFSMKWNMGWMHDSLAYFREDPLYRQHHHDRLTFAMMYACSENFVLPLSHDEVVHLKRSLLGRMPGDRWQQLANLRLLYTWQYAFPGKKLLFMGGELAQPTEWDFRSALPWHLLDDPANRGIQRLVGDLNRLYVADPRLHAREFEPAGFRWIDADDRQHSVLSFLRRSGDEPPAANDALVVVLNCTPVPRYGFRVGVPALVTYREILNSDSEYYGGSNVGNLAAVRAREVPAHGLPYSLDLTLPPLAGVILAPEKRELTADG